MADKKISELPLITTISGSIVYVPIVHDGITEKITVEDFSKFTNKYAAQTGSVNIFTANQTINANLSVNGTSTVSGNASVGGNLVVNGKLTAQEVHTEITSASIIFESGSTIFGNTADDTHQFTGIVSINGVSIGAGAINEFTASQLAVNLRIASTTGSVNTTTSSFNSEFIKIGSTTSSIHFTTQSLNTQTGSQDLVNLRISSTTGSINTTTSSFDSVFLRISSTTGSINTTTSSFDSVFLRISSTTGSINTTTSSFDSVFLGISSVTGAINTTTSSFNSEFIKIGSTTSSIHFTTQSLNTQTGSQGNLNAQIGIATGSLNAFTSSVIGQTNTISTFTASVNFTTQSLNTQTGSQDLVNLRISSTTGSINTTTSSFDSVFLRISSVTGSINAQSSSQDLVNYQNSIITSSYRIELNSIEAYTSSLKSAIIVNGSNVQIIGSLDVARLNVQYVSSSVLVTSGSNIFGDQTSDKHEFTGSVNLQDTLFIKGVAQGTGELNAFTGSQIGKDFTLSVVTSSIDSHILKQATQTGSQDLVNLGISTITGSLIGITNGLMALTASMKAQAIVSSSQQIIDYNTFAVTSSANTFYGIQTISGSLRVSGSLRGNIITGGLDVNGGITGSVKGNLDGVAAYATTIVVANSNTTTDTSLFPTFTTSPVLASYTSLFSHASSSFFLNGVTRRVHMEGFVVSGSNNTAEISGSLIVTGSSTITGSLNVTGSGTFTDTLTIQKPASISSLIIKNNSSTTGLWLYLNGLDATLSNQDNGKLSLQSNGTTAVEINQLAASNFIGAVTASNGKLTVGNSSTDATIKLSSDSSGGDSYIKFNADSDATKAQIYAHKNGASGGRLEFATLQSGVLNNVLVLDETKTANVYGKLVNTASGSNGQFILYQQEASYNTDAMSYFHNNANASTSWNFLKMFSGYPDNTQDVEFVFRGDGNAYADTGWTTPASDYAEYFESLNGEALPIGSTVVLVGNKIRVATESDTNIIGVIRPKGAALFLGNNEAQKWNGKYLKDDYGAYILDENGHRTLNPNYDSELTYVSRENRVEWNVVGLIGQIPITKGQVVNPNWIKMKDISANVEEWLVK
jgi:hypothetical protein